MPSNARTGGPLSRRCNSFERSTLKLFIDKVTMPVYHTQCPASRPLARFWQIASNATSSFQ
jgi:hypothetical protein